MSGLGLARRARRAAIAGALATLGLLGAVSAVHAQFESGAEAYAEGDYATALKEFEAASILGDARARFNIGNMYRTGTGVEQSPETAFRWYQSAAELGHAGAQNAVGSMYAMGLGVEQSDAQAYAWFSAAAALGNEIAEKNFARAKELITDGNLRYGEQLAKQYKATYVLPFLNLPGEEGDHNH